MRGIWRTIRARPGMVTGILIGLAVWPLLSGALSLTTRGLLAWDAGVLVFLGVAGYLFVSTTADRMPARAEAQEEGEWTIFGLTLAVVIVSFIAVSSEFSAIKRAPDAARGLQVTLVAATLFLSWLMTHVTFAFRYAHDFYADDLGGPDVDRGLEFPGEREPDYLDFLYFSLVLGMTFQVSDVQITSRKLRRAARAAELPVQHGHRGVHRQHRRRNDGVTGKTACRPRRGHNLLSNAEEQPDG